MASGNDKPDADAQTAAKPETVPLDMPTLEHPAPVRVERALKIMRRHGFDRAFVTGKLMAEFGIGQRTADDDYAAAKAQIRAQVEGDLPDLVGRVLESAWDQYEKADDEKDRRGTAAHLKLIAQVSGALTQRVEHSGAIRTDAQLKADRDLEEMIRGIVASAGKP